MASEHNRKPLESWQRSSSQMTQNQSRRGSVKKPLPRQATAVEWRGSAGACGAGGGGGGGGETQ